MESKMKEKEKETVYIIHDEIKVSREEYIKKKEELLIRLIGYTEKEIEKAKQAHEKKISKLLKENQDRKTKFEYLQHMKQDKDLKPLF